jgi:hypothetical protein
VIHHLRSSPAKALAALSPMLRWAREEQRATLA